VLINAGNSPSGVDFSARNVDINFASLDTIETMTDYTRNIPTPSPLGVSGLLGHCGPCVLRVL